MSQHDAPARLAVSTVIFALTPETDGDGVERPSLRLPLVRRMREPGLGRWALPGGWLPAHESLAAAPRARSARRPASPPATSSSSTRSASPIGPPASASCRSSTGHSCTPTRSSAPCPTRTCAGSTRTTARPRVRPRRDHRLRAQRLRTKLEYSRIAHALLPERFTMAELRGVHEAVLRAGSTRRTSVAPWRPPARSSTPASDSPAPGTARRPCTASTPPTPPRRRPHRRMRRRATRHPPPRTLDPAPTARTPRNEHHPCPSPRPHRPRPRRRRPARRGIRRPDHPPDHDRIGPGVDLRTRPRQGAVGVRRRTGRLRPGLLDGRRDPRRRAAPGRAARGVPPRIRRRARRAHPRRQGDARRPGRRARPLLPARRGRAARRLHRRLVPARQRRQDPSGRRGHRLLRRALHGRDRRHPLAARPGRDPAEPRRRLLDGRHGRHRASRSAGSSSRRSTATSRRPTPTAGCPSSR